MRSQLSFIGRVVCLLYVLLLFGHSVSFAAEKYDLRGTVKGIDDKVTVELAGTKKDDKTNRNGEPFYWIAKSYTKLGNTEFDLILESYEKSLALDLDKGLRLEVEKNYKIAKNRKSKLDSFWK